MNNTDPSTNLPDLSLIEFPDNYGKPAYEHASFFAPTVSAYAHYEVETVCEFYSPAEGQFYFDRYDPTGRQDLLPDFVRLVYTVYGRSQQNNQVEQIADLPTFDAATQLALNLGGTAELPYDLADWAETHYEISAAIATQEIDVAGGRGALWELSYKLTNKFQDLHAGYDWDGEFYDALESFILHEFGQLEPNNEH